MSMVIRQCIGFIGAGYLAGYALFTYGWSGPVIVPLSLSLIAALISWIGPAGLNELMELNDQLAGRSPEFHKRLKEGSGAEG
jgi:hypothetical protein